MLYVIRESDSKLVLVADKLEDGELQKIANHFGDVFVVRGKRIQQAAQHQVAADACPSCAGTRIVDKGSSMQRICVDCLGTGKRR